MSGGGVCVWTVAENSRHLIMVILCKMFFMWPPALIHRATNHTQTHKRLDQDASCLLADTLHSFPQADPSSLVSPLYVTHTVTVQHRLVGCFSFYDDSTHKARSLSPRTDINDNVHRVCSYTLLIASA